MHTIQVALTGQMPAPHLTTAGGALVKRARMRCVPSTDNAYEFAPGGYQNGHIVKGDRATRPSAWNDGVTDEQRIRKPLAALPGDGVIGYARRSP